MVDNVVDLPGVPIKRRKPQLSVVIPVYNKAPHINRSIGSVLRQSFSDFELIVVDDCSTDDSVEEIGKFRDSRLRLLRRDKPGPGGYAARNLGARNAQAQWIAFLDADDEWYPEHLARYVSLIQRFPHAKVLGCGWKVQERGVTEGATLDSYYAANHRSGDHELLFPVYLEAEALGKRPICTSVVGMRKDVLLGCGGFPEGRASRGGDVDTWLRCIEHAGGMLWSAHIGAVYYRDSVNMVTRTAFSDAANQRETVRALLQKHEGKVASLLKRFANRRTISAWKQNVDIGGKNFILFGRLYWSESGLHEVLLALASLLPNSVIRWLRLLYAATKS